MQRTLFHHSQFPTVLAGLGAGVSPVTRFWLLAFTGSLAFAASAQLVIPLFPVPVTAQTLVVMAFGLAVGWRLAGASVLLYLIEGLCGLPVFSKFGAGMGHLLGPTGGYLIGFVPAAVWCGWCAERGLDRKAMWLFVALLGAQLAVFVPGVLWLLVFVGDFTRAITAGLAPFILPELIKIALLSAVFPLIWLRLSR